MRHLRVRCPFLCRHIRPTLTSGPFFYEQRVFDWTPFSDAQGEGSCYCDADATFFSVADCGPDVFHVYFHTAAAAASGFAKRQQAALGRLMAAQDRSPCPRGLSVCRVVDSDDGMRCASRGPSLLAPPSSQSAHALTHSARGLPSRALPPAVPRHGVRARVVRRLPVRRLHPPGGRSRPPLSRTASPTRRARPALAGRQQHDGRRLGRHRVRPFPPSCCSLFSPVRSPRLTSSSLALSCSDKSQFAAGLTCRNGQCVPA